MRQVKPRRKPTWRTRLDQGTVYCIKAKHPTRSNRKRLITAYIGKYGGDWKERIRQHLYGGGRHNAVPKFWADTVPGYDHNAKTLKAQRAAVEAVIAAGGAFPIWGPKPCRYGWMGVRESWAIRGWRRPYYNILENTDNPRHIPKWEAERQRLEREVIRKEIELVGVHRRHRWLTFLNPAVVGRQQKLENGKWLETGPMFEKTR